MIPKLITAPTIYPVTMDDIKDHLRITSGNTDQEFYLMGLRDSAIAQAENITGRALMTQTWACIYDSWAEMTEYNLPMGQLQSVSSIVYNDTDGSSQTVSTDDYLVYGIGTDDGKILIHSDSDFDYPDLYEKDPVTVTFLCGWTADTLPATVKTAILLMVESVYNDVDAQMAIDAHLRPHRIYSL